MALNANVEILAVGMGNGRTCGRERAVATDSSVLLVSRDDKMLMR
jgi:hypothetical protein